MALASVLRDYPGTVLQVSPASAGMGVEEADRKMMIDMSVAAGRPLFYLVLQVKDSNCTMHERMLALCDEAKEKGGLIYVPRHSKQRIPGPARFQPDLPVPVLRRFGRRLWLSRILQRIANTKIWRSVAR